MRPSTLFFRAAGVAILTSIISAAPALSQTATTDPVGFITVNAQGNSDSYTYLPFKRTPEYAGAVLTPGGVSGSIVTIAGTPNFSVNQFVYVAGTQPKKYYALFTSGPKIGMYSSITANDANHLTLDSAGDDISGVSGATLNIIPYDTLGSLFPAGQGIVPSAGVGAIDRRTEILIPDNATAGTDLASGKIYFYYSGTAFGGAGWRSTSTPLTAKVDEDKLLPDTSFIIRQNSATASQVTFMGTVHMGTLSTPIGTISDGLPQDNAIALPIAAELTLAQSKLFESGAFVGSAGVGAIDRKDEVYVRDNSVAGRDKAADKIYFYYTGTAFGGAGWRRTDLPLTSKRDTDIVISPNLGLTVRKAPTVTASSVIWSVKPPYVP